MKTIRLEVIEQSHVFQPGCMFHVPDLPSAGPDHVYPVPDTGNGLPGFIPAKNVVEVSREEEASDAYYGKCLLTRVTNFFKNNKELDSEESDIGIVKPENVRVIHYPDCQQIVFHMPKYAYDAGDFRVTDLVSGEAIVACAVRDQLNGGTMILLDSLPLKPGFYSMEADWPGGWTHEVRFIKFQEGYPKLPFKDAPDNVIRAIKNDEKHLVKVQKHAVPEPEEASEATVKPPYEGYQHPPGNVSIVQNDKEYRLFDSNGVEIHNGIDLNQFQKEVFAKFGWVLDYEQEGRGGSITYLEGDIKIKFDWEFAGGKALVLIFIPEEKYWEGYTGTPLSRRLEILDRMATQVIKDKAPGHRYEIDYNCVTII